MVLSPQLQKQLDAVPKARRIRVLNDNARTTFTGCRVMLTRSIVELPIDVRARIILAVQAYKDFDDETDPHKEHDYGALEVDGIRVLWKFDYYDRDIRYGADDPADPENTTRVLTIMLAEEY